MFGQAARKEKWAESRKGKIMKIKKLEEGLRKLRLLGNRFPVVITEGERKFVIGYDETDKVYFSEDHRLGGLEETLEKFKDVIETVDNVEWIKL